MVEPIKAKLVLDVSSMKSAAVGLGGKSSGQGFAEGLRGALQGLDLPILGDIGAALAGGVLVLEKMFSTIKKGFGFLVQSSPLLASSINILTKSMQVLLRPIGDAIGLFIKPFAIAMLRFAIPIYKKWREFLDSDTAQTGLGQINEGATNVANGIFSLDFDQVKEGLGQIFSGLKGIVGGFLGFMNINVVDLLDSLVVFADDAWTFFVETFNKVSAWIAEKLTIGFTNAWNAFWTLIGALGDEDWKLAISGLKTGLDGVWDGFMSIVQAYSKYGPILAPMIVALEGLFGAMDFGPMMENLKTKFADEFPTIAAIIDSGESEGGLMSRLWSAIKVVGEYLSVEFTEIFTSFRNLANLIFTEDIPDALKETDGSLNTSMVAVDLLNVALMSIPTQIVTTHIIRTVYETVNKD